jgi:transketolase
MDAVEKVGNGHPGTAMALAPVAYTLFQKVMRHNPKNPEWIARDRFILSCGHSSITLYTQLFLGGFGLEMEDLKSFRTMGSKTPGHPEFGHTAGVETTTGPLGQGVANAVGMAMAQRFVRGLLDPESAPTESLFDHNIWVIASDGDLQEGVSAEASSLAGTQRLGNLKVIYDDNRISIEGDTHLSFTEDVSTRYRAYGWEVFEVGTKSDGDIDLTQLNGAIDSALAITDRPVLIRMKSVIAWPAPTARNTAKSHGSALGKQEVAATKIELGLDPDSSFAFPDSLLNKSRQLSTHGEKWESEWRIEFEKWKKKWPARAALLDRLLSSELPSGWAESLPRFDVGGSVATRKASGDVIQAIASAIPEIWGGSADLAESNNTMIHKAKSFLPAGSSFATADPFGRNIHFGIREHAMGAIANGIALYGLSRIYVGTFLVFSDYMRGSIRLSALMNLPVTFIFTHDSIGLGEDGPTHQPVEHAAALRAIPNLTVIRPADGNEVVAVWKTLLESPQPAAILLSRQNLPILDIAQDFVADGVPRGAYIALDASNPQAIIIATGSEVHIAMSAARELSDEGIPVRVVSAPSFEWFAQQSVEYREKVLPTTISARVSVEAGISQGWREWIGDRGKAISMEGFGASASAPELFAHFGFTTDRIKDAVKEVIRGS